MPTAAKPMPARPAMLRAGIAHGRPVRVDRQAEVIHGYTLAQEGPFKSQGRGEFDRAALQTIVTLANAHPKGLKCRFQHPSLSDDGLGKLVGRLDPGSAYLDKSGPVWLARADLRVMPISHEALAGDIGKYVLDLAEQDPDAFSSSLVVEHDEEFRREKDGTLTRDAAGEVLPPLWRPTKLWATDVVDTGDAVDGLLSAQNLSVDDLPDALQRRGWEALDKLFAGQPADVVRERVAAYVERYVAARGLAAATVPPGAVRPARPQLSSDDSCLPPRPNRDRAGRILGRLGLTAR